MRHGWQFPNSFNTQFRLNTASALTRGLYGLWIPQRTPGGATIFDLVKQNNGTVNGPSWSIDSSMGYGLDYPASGNNRIDSIEGLTFSANDWISICVWIKPDTIPNYGTILTTNSTTGGGVGFYTFTTNTFGFSYYNDAAGYDECEGPANCLSTNELQLVSMSYQFGNGNTMALYLNGKYQTPTWTSGDGDSTPGILKHDIWFGNDTWSERFDGTIFAGAIWLRKLSAQEHLALYQPVTRWELYAPARRVFVVKAPAGGASYDVSMTLTRTAGIAEAGGATAGGAATLAKAMGISEAGEATAGAAMALAKAAGIAEAGGATAGGAMTLGRAAGIAEAGGATAGGAVAFNRSVAVTLGGDVTAEALVTLTRAAGLATDREAEFNAALTLSFDLGVSASGGAVSGAALDLARSEALTLAGQAVAAAGLALDQIISITLAGDIAVTVELLDVSAADAVVTALAVADALAAGVVASDDAVTDVSITDVSQT